MIHFPKEIKKGDIISNKKGATYTVIANNNGNITAIKTEIVNENNYKDWDLYMRIIEMVDSKCQKYGRDVI